MSASVSNCYDEMRNVPISWQRELAASITDARELIEALKLPAELVEPAQRAAQAFGLRVTRSFVARMRPGDVNDPLLRQVLPLGDELLEAPGFVSDPLDEEA